jgi:hypothetical protein
MSHVKIPSKYRCSCCKRDLRARGDEGGCLCDRSHSNGGRKVPLRHVDYEPWDGYSWYEFAKYVKDRED